MLPAVAALVPASLSDWDDRVSDVLVLQGCNLRCPFCHSAEFVRAGRPEREVPWDEIRAGLESPFRDLVTGVVISGGEPTIHEGLAGLAEAVTALGRPVKLDTNGTNPRRLRELAERGLVRRVALDVKAPLEPAAYARATGVEPARGEAVLAAVRESLDLLRSLPAAEVEVELRTTLCPAVFPPPREGGRDRPEGEPGGPEEGRDSDLLAALARELAWAPEWHLQPFRPKGCLDPGYERLPGTDPGRLRELVARCRSIAPGCRARA